MNVCEKFNKIPSAKNLVHGIVNDRDLEELKQSGKRHRQSNFFTQYALVTGKL